MNTAAHDGLGSPLFDDGAVELEVREVMTAGVVTVADGATLGQAVDAMAEHRVHAVLVVGRPDEPPLGWVTTRGLLGLLGSDERMPATEAITEEARAIEPTATVRSAIYALALPGVTRLLVRWRDSAELQGVVTDYDLTVRALQRARLNPRRA